MRTLNYGSRYLMALAVAAGLAFGTSSALASPAGPDCTGTLGACSSQAQCEEMCALRNGIQADCSIGGCCFCAG